MSLNGGGGGGGLQASVIHYMSRETRKKERRVKIRFIPPLFFYWQYVFPMYFLITRLFSSMAFLSEMHSLRDIGWVRLG